MQSCQCTAVAACVAPGSSSRSLAQKQQRATRFAPSRGRRSCTRIQAIAPGVQAPKGVTQPPKDPQVPPAAFGFVDNAERINSRACMIGFFALIAVEAIAHRGFLELLGIRVGQGLGFEI